MADELDGLLARVEDPALRADLRAHIDRIRTKRTFGLVFESHLPERIRLPEHPVRTGSKVAFRDDPKSATYQVIRVRNGKATIRKIRHPDGSRLAADEEAGVVDEEHTIDTLVVIADFGESIYPGLRRLGSVDRGGDKPAHVVIKGENHHVLEALQFTHAGKVDCIYIDPPYNTGARDWKYDNNYVDDTDAYRHSKWLAFMERRLLLARELLNPECSVLIVTIDEREYLRLGMLLEQTFPEARITMVTTSISAGGVSRTGTFGRSSEYIFFVQFGTSRPLPQPLGPEWNAVNTANKADIYWSRLLRAGTSALRSDRPNQFYPIFLSGHSGTACRALERFGPLLDAPRMTSLVDRLLPKELWLRIQPLLPPAPPRPRGGVPRRIPDRNCVAALIFMARTSTPWALLPARELGCGSPSTCRRRLDEWARAGVFDQLQAMLLDELGAAGRIDLDRVSVDSFSLRAVKGGT